MARGSAAVPVCLLALFRLTSAASCEVAIVGAGAGGALAAWQAAEAGKQVCIFELTDRPGGRIHSLRGQGPKRDLVVEAGAYRFAPKEVCEDMGPGAKWCVRTPITAAAVKKLNLHAGVYDPDPQYWDYEMRKLVDKHGQNVGYLTLVETMLELAVAKGAELHYNTPVLGLAGTNKSQVALLLKSGKTVEASSVVLNIPQKPLLKLLRHSKSPFVDVFPAPLYDPVSFDIMKLYVYYDDAWWRNYLDLKAGPFYNNNPDGKPSPVIHMHSVPDESPAPLMGQYHDGDIRCDRHGKQCRGYLQAFYSGGGALDFYKNYHPLNGEAAVEITRGTAEHRQLLQSVHHALVALHRKDLDAANATDYVKGLMPESGVLSIWSEGVAGINAGCHNPKNGNHPKPADLAKAALQPFKDWPVFVADEAYGPVHCFAEASLNMTVSALEGMGIPRPTWLEEELKLQVPQRGHIPLPPTDPFLMPGSAEAMAHRTKSEMVV